MLQLAGADRVLTMDLHAGQVQGFFTIPVDHMTALPLFARHFRDLGLTGEGVVSVSPDAGRARLAVRFAEMIDAEFAIMHKTRPAHDQVSVTEITGRVRDKVAIVGDDVIMTGRHVARRTSRRSRSTAPRTSGSSPRTGSSAATRWQRFADGEHHRHRRHRHGADRPAQTAGEPHCADRLGTPRRDDHERVQPTTRSRRSSAARTSSSRNAAQPCGFAAILQTDC